VRGGQLRMVMLVTELVPTLPAASFARAVTG
jgi:hypothetical protein